MFYFKQQVKHELVSYSIVKSGGGFLLSSLKGSSGKSEYFSLELVSLQLGRMNI
jgi:hypothetical protein